MSDQGLPVMSALRRKADRRILLDDSYSQMKVAPITPIRAARPCVTAGVRSFPTLYLGPSSPDT